VNHDPIDELARRLFAAARDERPDHALRERMQPADGRTVPALQRSRAADDPPHSGLRGSASILRPRRRTRWLLAATLGAVALGAVAWVDGLLVEAQAPPLTISAEGPARLPARPQPAVDAVPSATPSGEAAALDVPSTADPAPPAAPSPARIPRSAASRPAMSDRGSTTPGRDAMPPVAAPPSSSEAAAAPSVSAVPVPPPPPASVSSALLTELNLLKQARAAVRSGEHQTALTLLDRHATELHRTELTTEATLLRIEALAALGRHGEASNLARRFVAENPNSPLVDRAQHFIDQPNRDGSR
jgi:hypothetical protein